MTLRGRELAGVLLLFAVGLQQQALVTAAATTQQATQQDADASSQKDPKQAAAGRSEAAFSGANVLPGDIDPVSEAMLEWLRTNGAEVNVAIRTNVPGSGRGTFAPNDIKKGGVLARIPVEMVYALTDQEDTLAVSGTYLVADMAEDDSPWAPYFNHLPGPTDVWSSANLPTRYLPIIQDEFTELAITQMQESITTMWDTYGDTYKKVMGPEVTPANITHAVALLLTRLFRFDSLDILIPVLDMANHQNGCLHSHMPEPCDPEEGFRDWKAGNRTAKLAPTAGSGVFGAAAASSSSDSDSDGSSDRKGSKNSKGSSKGGMSGQCMVWRAEEDVAVGQEVCNSYKTLFQDRALLQYGFLQSGAPTRELSMLDRHEQKDAGAGDVWADPDDLNNLHGPRRFEGAPSELRAEIERLSARLASLEAADPAMAAIKPDPELDAQGHRLAVMLEWRRQRKEAIKSEIARLQRQASRVEQWQQVWGPDGAAGLEKVNKELLSWLEANGAKVSVELRAASATSKDQQTCSAAADGSSSQPACSTKAVQGAVPPAFPPNAGVFTTKQLQQGDMLAVIPVELGYAVRKGIQKLESAVDLMTDIQAVLSPEDNTTASASTASSSSSSGSGSGSAASSKAVLLRSLPPFGSVRGLVNFPPQYLPIIQQPRAETYIKLLQTAVSEEFESHRPKIEARDNSTSHAELQYAVALIANQRPLASVNVSGEEQQLLVPFFSNARYNSSCPHNASVEPCPGISGSSSSDSPLCFIWRAGVDMPAGAEVFALGPYLRDDQALLMYGLTLEQAAALRQQAGDSSSSSSKGEMWLSGLDSQASSNEEPFGVMSSKPLEHWEAGDRDEALTECIWLMELHTNWTDPEVAANISSVQPVASDPGGAFLQQLLLWRQQRIASVEWELARLMTVWEISSKDLKEAAAQHVALQEIEAGSGDEEDGLDASGSGYGAAIDGDFSSDSSDPWQRMLDWMRHNGALINVNVTYAGPQNGRVVVVNEPMLRGDLLAAIPIDLVWNAQANGGSSSLQMAATIFAADMESPDSPHRPYFDSLPLPDELLCPLISLPAEYLHLLQSPKAETYVTKYQGNLMAFWEGQKGQLMSSVPSMTTEKFLHARALLATRLFGLQVGASMVPLLDLANHVRENTPSCQQHSTAQGTTQGTAQGTAQQNRVASYQPDTMDAWP